MIDFPNAKINLGLRVLDKRSDGYHNISTIMYPVKDLYDVLEIIPSNKLTFECAGPYSKGLTENNLCLNAYNMLHKTFNIPPVHLYLYKNIPVGAGLGGGSSDAAFTLKLINVIFSLGLTDEQLLHYALLLGSDCPFFIKNKPSHATGRGEILKEFPIDLHKFKIDVKMPDVKINTEWAYKQLALTRTTHKDVNHIDDDILEAVSLKVENWKTHLHNDFEPIVFKDYIEVKRLKEAFYENGALYASMSGSGAAVYSVTPKN